jgi:hypothetical protein
MMNLFSGFESVLDSGAVQAAVDVGSSSGLWDGVTNFATGAFDWMGDNPEATNILGGIAMGAASGYMQNEQAEDQRAFKREMYDKKREDRFSKPGEINGYDSYLNNTIAGNGLITNGMIAENGG